MREKIAHEKELLHSISQGDQQAFESLFDAYRSVIYLTALRLTQSAAISEEIVQDVFLKLWIKRSSLTRIDNFSAWLFTVAQNHIYTAMRRQQRGNFIKNVLQSMTPSAPDDARPGFQQLLEEAVDHLPARQKETYILIKQEGLKRQQAASILQVSAETVKSNLEHAIRNIKAYCMANKEAT